MKLNNILIAILVFLVVIYLLISNTKNTEKFATVFGSGTNNLCSATNCGSTGTRYRMYNCVDENNNQVDYSLCGNANNFVDCTANSETCQVPITYSWKTDVLPDRSNVSAGPECAYSGFQYTESIFPKCIDNNNLVVDDGLCGTVPDTLTSIVSYTGASCTTNTSNSIGLQNYHYLLGGVYSSNSILGGHYSNSNGVQFQKAKYVTTNSLLRLPLAMANLKGSNTPNINTLILPKGLSGYFLVILFYPLAGLNDPISLNATIPPNVPTGSIELVQNYFNSGQTMQNTIFTTKKLFYYILPIKINDDTVSTAIKFSCSDVSFNLDTTKYPDLFVLQASSFGNSVCGNVADKEYGFRGNNCSLGTLPLMARYKFYGASNTEPLGFVNSLYKSNQISDNIGLTFTQTSSYVTVNIPAVSTYLQSTGTTVKFLIMIGWTASYYGLLNATITPGTGGDYASFKALSYAMDGLDTGANTTINSGSGDLDRNLFICQTLSLPVTSSSSFDVYLTMSVDSNFIHGINGDLVIIQHFG